MRPAALPVMLAAALAVAPAGAAASPPDVPEIFAVVVGHNGGAAGLPTLRFADDDALRFLWLFSGLTAADHVWLLAEVDADTRAELARAGSPVPPARLPTRTQVFRALDELRERLARRDRRRPAAVYFVYAGHGRSGRFLLQSEGGAEAAVTGRELRAAVAGLAADRATLFFDACRSQSLFVERGGDAGPDLSAQIDELEHRAGAVKIGVLVAATSDKPAGETVGLRGGAFSHALVSGLAGAADADGDDVVRFGELAAFVAWSTVRLTGQRPWFDPPGGDLGAPALDHRSNTTLLVLPTGQSGRFAVSAAGGGPVLVTASKEAGRPLRLALPPGRYRIARIERDGSGRAGEIELSPGQPSELPGDALTIAIAAPTGAERGDVDEPGFETPFSADVVSTLAAGYRSGREPTALRRTWRHALRVGFGAGGAPLDLGGVEQGVSLGYRRALGRFFAGVSADVRASHHDLLGQGYDLRRTGLMLESGARVFPTRRLELGALVGGGLRGVYRMSASRTAGDPTAPAVAGSAFAEIEIAWGWAAWLDARYDLAWVKIDGKRESNGVPMAGLGVAWRR